MTLKSYIVTIHKGKATWYRKQKLKKRIVFFNFLYHIFYEIVWNVGVFINIIHFVWVIAENIKSIL